MLKHSMKNVSTKTMAMAMGVDIPPEFICPITSEVMIYPLMTRSGINFERSSIIERLQNGNDKCPVTKKVLLPSDLIPNRLLEEQIAKWRFENMLLLPDPSPSSEDIVIGIVSPTKKVQKVFFQRICQKLNHPSTILSIRPPAA